MGAEVAQYDGPIMVHRFVKNALEEVRVSLEEYHGRKLIDLRVYYDAGGGVRMPSKKGLALSVEQLPELAKAVAKAQEAVGKGTMATD